LKERVTLSKFHTLLHPYNTSLVSCCDSGGEANIITIAWVIPVSVEPPFIGMSIRPTRYSYQLIKETGEFVINIAPYALAEQALCCGRRSGRDIDKFAKTGLTPGKAVRVRPPIIEECLAHLECRTVKDIEAGDHRLLLGEVLEASIDPQIIDQHGLYDLNRVDPLLHLGRNRFTTAADRFIEPPL
jgi:flavin reductase (DIM6/NTAB) family NADH-FMN oxidoreductase RutF